MKKEKQEGETLKPLIALNCMPKVCLATLVVILCPTQVPVVPNLGSSHAQPSSCAQLVVPNLGTSCAQPREYSCLGTTCAQSREELCPSLGFNPDTLAVRAGRGPTQPAAVSFCPHGHTLNIARDFRHISSALSYCSRVMYTEAMLL